MSDSKTVVFGASHVSKAISDPNFFSLLPEFLPIQTKIKTMNVDLSTGCSPCKKRRIATSVNSDFVSILNNLSDDGFQRLKKWVGADRLLVHAMDRAQGKPVLKEV